MNENNGITKVKRFFIKRISFYSEFSRQGLIHEQQELKSVRRNYMKWK